MLDVLVRTPAGKVARRGLPIFRGKIADEKWISRWVSLAVPVAEEIRREEPLAETELLARRTEEGAVLLSLENLLSYA